ncbi:MAG: cryptochrome/photolyase family protein [Phycisphaerales bacterium JB039]
MPATRMPSLRVTGPVRKLAIVFGDQLDHDSAALRDLDPQRDAVLMMEVAEEATAIPSHRQRTTLFLAAMRHFAIELAGRSIRIQYTRLDDAHNTQSLATEIQRHTDRLKPERIICVHPGEWRVLDMVQSLEAKLGHPVEILPDDHFYTSLDDFNTWMDGRKEVVLEHFYRKQRRDLGILVDDRGNPEGGQWNYDKENRQSFKQPPDPPTPYAARPDEITREVMDLVQRRFPDAPGRMDHFHWPVTRAEAQRALRDFIDNRLPHFGTWQDAMWTGERTLYHSRLSAPLNLKLLNPRNCVEAALDAWRTGAAPLNAVEGFIRQLIGWREFIRGIYWWAGRGYARRNHFRQQGELPRFYWTGATDMRCMADSLGQVLDDAYGHHIQRLMVTGNFALLAGVHPKAISDWYLAMYADAVEWVTLPNTLGMVMHADGGLVGTKPYIATGQYIDRMSNYCDTCRYDPRQRTGADACPFTTMYWDFLIRHEDDLRDNRRMTMALGNLRRLTAEQRAEITREGKALRRRLAGTA